MLESAAQYRRWVYAFVCVGVLTNHATGVAQEDDEDSRPGLMAKYSVDEQTIERVDSGLSFDWGVHAPDQRLPSGRFSAEWSGSLLVRTPGIHRFHAFVAGDVTIVVDGRTVLKTSQQWGFASGEPVELSAGDRDIKVTYATPSESDKSRAKLAVFWSSDAFTLEPLPADALFRNEASLAWIDARGRFVADAHRCSACHQSNSGLAALKAPALDRVRGSQSTKTLLQRLMNSQAIVANSHMPDFGMTEQEASSVAAFLLSVSKDAHKDKDIKFKDGDAAAGTMLLNSLGCVACHRLSGTNPGTAPLAEPYDGPELANVGKRRSAAWIDRWLRDPQSLNGDHRMPVFDLSSDERRQLVAVLTKGDAPTQTDSSLSTNNADLIAAGKQLVTAANCAACHQIPGLKSSPLPPLTDHSFEENAVRCFHPHASGAPNEHNGHRLPFFPILGSRADAVMDWFSTMRHDSPLSAADQGEWLLKRNGCVACHDRNQERGLSSIAADLQKTHPDLNGQSQGLVPPPLTAVGDKLNDDYLKKAVSGEQKERRLPWLLVRMPKFKHTDADRAAIVQHLITTDRIPDEADAARQDVLAHVNLGDQEKPTADELLLGNQLTGAGGFNCVACHKAGPFEPRNVALGTRGSDIMTMGRQIRSRFFQRWMKNPIRVVAGIEMPAIKKAMPDVLDGSLPKQIGVIWNAISDERFTPPTVTSRFEQVVNVAPDQSPRIIRDVFTIGTDKHRQAVARAMAIGFANGHNILIDLDTMQVRLWTIGEFARQRTEGKGWYWDMPGTVVQHAEENGLAHRLVAETGSAKFAPVIDESRASELLSWRILPDAVELTCRSWFDLSGKSAPKTVDDEPHFSPTAWDNPLRPLQAVVTRQRFGVSSHDSTRTGWQRSVEVLECPPGFRFTASATDLLPDSDGAIKVVRKSAHSDGVQSNSLSRGQQASLTVSTGLRTTAIAAAPVKPPIIASIEQVTTTPGFIGTRLPIDMSIMPTAMTWLPDGRMAFTSLKGHVWIASDTDDDGLPDSTTLFEEGLSAPFGILADADALIVAHKPEILKLRDTDGDGRADVREVVASGWGFNDNYHDWTTGLIRDADGNMYVGLGSDYSQNDRPQDQDRWRGGVIKIDPSGIITPLGMSMRYPMGLAFDRHGNLFATDNQGVQNTFNEINHILPGKHYGVPSRHQPTDGLNPEWPALAVPHPWTRSMNSILFLPDDFAIAGLRGHGIGCEYDSRFLIRFTVQNVDGILQGASYRFSLPNQEAGGSNFIGPICSAVAPDGTLYIGSIWDSGWQGGQNTGGITRLVPSPDDLPNGIRELTARSTGFDVEFFKPVDAAAVAEASSWSIQGYTRDWGGSYATPDSGRYTLTPEKIEVLDAGKRIRITVKELKPGYVYDVSTTGTLAESQKLWPSEAHYSMKVVPK